MKSHRQIILYRSDIRKLFNIPEDVHIAGVGNWQEPLGIQITLIGDDEKHWPSMREHSWDSSENDESRPLQKEDLEKWRNQ